MSIQSFSSRDFARDVPAAKRAAANGPVFITDRGQPAFALLEFNDYYRLAGQQPSSLLDVMDSIAGGENIDFEPPRRNLIVQSTTFESV